MHTFYILNGTTAAAYERANTFLGGGVERGYLSCGRMSSKVTRMLFKKCVLPCTDRWTPSGMKRLGFLFELRCLIT